MWKDEEKNPTNYFDQQIFGNIYAVCAVSNSVSGFCGTQMCPVSHRPSCAGSRCVRFVWLRHLLPGLFLLLRHVSLPSRSVDRVAVAPVPLLWQVTGEFQHLLVTWPPLLSLLLLCSNNGARTEQKNVFDRGVHMQNRIIFSDKQNQVIF